ncbi:MAG: rod shape-determining protein RodA [Flavipsychrobacter sp.]
MGRNSKSVFGRIDGITFVLYLLLIGIGLLSIFSVEYSSTDTRVFVFSKSHGRQIMWLFISLFFGLLILFTDTKFFSSIAYMSYTIGLFLLIITIFVGIPMKGSQSWLGVGSFKFQPGEVCKIFTSLALAKFLSSPETQFKELKYKLIGVAIALMPAVFIVLQKETGLALVYLSFILVLYREGLPHSVLIIGFSSIALTLATLLVDKTTLFVAITAIAVLLAVLLRNGLKKGWTLRLVLIGSWLVCILFSQVIVPITFKHVLQKHQIERIYSTLGQQVPEEYLPEKDRGKKRKGISNYNVTQSKIAIGSGGFSGKGYLNGTSTKNEFVPEQNTDFIFCAVGEQFGFLGSTVLVLIYLMLMLRIVYLAEEQRSVFSRVYAYCVASILFFHFAINVSMTIGIAPVIGITLPLLSYGGSSLLSFSILIFILLRLDADRQVLIR